MNAGVDTQLQWKRVAERAVHASFRLAWTTETRLVSTPRPTRWTVRVQVHVPEPVDARDLLDVTRKFETGLISCAEGRKHRFAWDFLKLHINCDDVAFTLYGTLTDTSKEADKERPGAWRNARVRRRRRTPYERVTLPPQNMEQWMWDSEAVRTFAHTLLNAHPEVLEEIRDRVYPRILKLCECTGFLIRFDNEFTPPKPKDLLLQETGRRLQVYWHAFRDISVSGLSLFCYNMEVLPGTLFLVNHEQNTQLMMSLR